jgi:phosphoglycolate phosphatase
LCDAYIEALRAGSTTIRALPGALALLEALAAEKDFNQSVVTGNVELTAQVKLEAAGLHKYLHRGAYASDSHNRSELPWIAKERWERSAGKPLRPEQCVIVGDTPKDLEAARQNHMKCVLVGTGRYPVEELEYFKPDACLPDLTDTVAVLGTLTNL